MNGQAYTWDANGNLTNDGNKVYTYTQATRLVTVTGSGLTWSATYNGDGVRLRQMVNGKFYLTGDIFEKDLNFGLWQVLLATVDYNRHIPITHFLAGFKYSVHASPPDRVAFMIKNQTDRTSGTHFPGRYEPAYEGSLEDLLNRHRELEDIPASVVVWNNRVISVLKELSGAETAPPIWRREL